MGSRTGGSLSHGNDDEDGYYENEGDDNYCEGDLYGDEPYNNYAMGDMITMAMSNMMTMGDDGHDWL